MNAEDREVLEYILCSLYDEWVILEDNKTVIVFHDDTMEIQTFTIGKKSVGFSTKFEVTLAQNDLVNLYDAIGELAWGHKVEQDGC